VVFTFRCHSITAAAIKLSDATIGTKQPPLRIQEILPFAQVYRSGDWSGRIVPAAACPVDSDGKQQDDQTNKRVAMTRLALASGRSPMLGPTPPRLMAD